MSLTVESLVAAERNPLAVFLEIRKEGWLDALLLLNTPPVSYNFDAGIVYMETSDSARQLATDLHTTYAPLLAIVKLSVNDCNLRPSGAIDLSVADQAGAVIQEIFDPIGWGAIAVNLPVPATRTTRLIARRKEPASSDAGAEAIIAVANLVLREHAVTLAPFITPTP